MLSGSLYPLVITGVAQALFGDKADGSLIERDGEVVGSALIGQAFSGARVLPRPALGRRALASGSPARRTSRGDPTRPAARTTSRASNLGPTNPDLLAAVEERVDAYREVNGLADDAKVPVDAVTARARASTRTSRWPTPGCRPPGSPTSAGSRSTRCSRWSTTTPTSRSLGFLGEQGVNVLELNLALDQLR